MLPQKNCEYYSFTIKITFTMNIRDYRYQLESPRVTGHRQQKTTCPQCGRKRCFVRYVDTHNNCQYLGDDIGRCDHEQSCGYHKRPEKHSWQHSPSPQVPPSPGRGRGWAAGSAAGATPVWAPLPQSYVLKTHSPQSNFWQWMLTAVRTKLGLDEQALQRVYSDYCIGATVSHDIIFWQIDTDYRVHTGHVMRYNDQGHRCGPQDWMHSRLQRDGLLSPEWTLRQCLFGQHLLRNYPDRQVGLVESEKTALIMAACQPDLLWLATAGSGGLSADKLACLQGRTVRIFPDSGCYGKWKQKMALTAGIDYYISPQLEAWPPNTDLADLLL